ncbi:uncharacterized protein DSM5745_03265 [Aspergillus mulundensis]|uniref:Uncharacterized protein n=1 Tax=Aspergillus mulundensis TaxID=1810919 RepID=A0A3D8SJZ1_9EURO|nr:Uncharacterized protein DSM5745_03265 [Aspergillus mulundensis]RDW86623.1 Uncharacterized protein DSM5745_03265 [Aspergillus mulundensis]
MDSDTESLKKPVEKNILLDPAVLFLSAQSVVAEADPSTPLYVLSTDIRSIPNKNSSVKLERVENVDDGPDGSQGAPPKRHQHIFYLVHPEHAQYRTDIPARYYITSAVPETVGNIRLEASEARLQRTSFRALLSAGKTASDRPLFNEGAQQLVLFEIQPSGKVGLSSTSYKWSDSKGDQVATEGKENSRYYLKVTSSLPQDVRDALVATWLLRLWHDTAESKEAKREFFESMTSPEAYRESVDGYMKRQCILM